MRGRSASSRDVWEGPPIRDVVVPGEEVAMVFTEPINCELPYQFDLEVRLSGMEDLLDKRNLKIHCHEQTLAFQFDPTRIKYELLIGRDMKVKVTSVADLQVGRGKVGVDRQCAFTLLLYSPTCFLSGPNRGIRLSTPLNSRWP